VKRYGLSSRVGTILFAPVYQKLSCSDLADWVLSCDFPVRLQPQLHKIIWPDIQRGV